MEALVWHGAAQLGIEDLPDPEAGDGEVVVDVELAGICGSDLHAYRGAAGNRVPPLVLGHEAVGRVAGDKRLYLLFPLAGCQRCEICRSGHENLCPERRLLGLDRQGTFAARVAVPSAALLEVPGGLTADVATLTEPCATVVGAFRGIDITAGTRVAVVGCGAIGLLAVHLAHHAGATVVACDPVEERRRAAQAAGANLVLTSASELPVGRSHLVMDAVGTEATWSAAIEATQPGGTVVVVGLAQAIGAMAVGQLVRAGITVRGSYAYTRADFLEALRLLGETPPPASWLRHLPLAEGVAAFRSLVDRPEESIKILLSPGGASS